LFRAATWSKRALKQLQKMKSKNSVKLALAHKTYGFVLPELKKTELALKHLQKAYELNSKDPYIPAVIGELYQSQERLNDAIKWFHTALQYKFYFLFVYSFVH
jgi:tetratricopeptide (TPR) repeat protein